MLRKKGGNAFASNEGPDKPADQSFCYSLGDSINTIGAIGGKLKNKCGWIRQSI